MRIEYFYYFIIIAECKSLNKAANRLFISQQHLSRVVQKLEEETHSRLLIRNSDGVALTAQGEQFLTFATNIYNEYRNMHTYFFLENLPKLPVCETITGSCRFGYPFFFSLHLLSFLQKFQETYPCIAIQCFENESNDFTSIPTNGSAIYLQVGALHSNDAVQNQNRLKRYTIAQSQAYVCVNRHSSLSNRQVISIEEFQTLRSTGYNNATFNLKHSNVLFISGNIEQHLNSVVQNQSVCTVPTYARPYIQAHYPDIVLIPLKTSELFPVQIVHDAAYEPTEADICLMRFITSYIHSLIN